jgi:hypothetical protein
MVELTYESGLPARQFVRESVLNSEVAYTLLLKNDVLGIMGIGRSPTDPRGGKVWFLGSKQLEKSVDFELVRQSRNLVAAITEDFEISFNLVSEENISSIRWLDWAGFEFIRRIPAHGVAKKPFWLFARARTPEIRKKWDSIFGAEIG